MPAERAPARAYTRPPQALTLRRRQFYTATDFRPLARRDMFGNLRTATKMFILSGMFIVSIAVAPYGLVVEKQAAVSFARKELAGSRYLAVVRDLYGAVATGLTDDAAYARARERADAAFAALAAAESAAVGTLQTADFARALDAELRVLWSGRAGGA